MKTKLHRIVAMLTRMAMKFDGVAEPVAAFDADIDYDNEHRCAEHEHEWEFGAGTGLCEQGAIQLSRHLAKSQQASTCGSCSPS